MTQKSREELRNELFEEIRNMNNCRRDDSSKNTIDTIELIKLSMDFNHKVIGCYKSTVLIDNISKDGSFHSDYGFVSYDNDKHIVPTNAIQLSKEEMIEKIKEDQKEEGVFVKVTYCATKYYF